ncbi:MAG TPA: hypothetical protein VGV61_10905, partial [Thermoanaerobaculia bacterium]|nr:hypothetical protein [Thermoanaerobaculia bacterium]
MDLPLSRIEAGESPPRRLIWVWLGGGLGLAACWSAIVYLGRSGPEDPRLALPVAGLLFVALAAYFSRPSFERRMVTGTTATRLGAIRAVTCGIALLMTLAERLPLLAEMGSALRQGHGRGFGKLLDALPFYRPLLASPEGLAVIQWATALLLLAAAIGYHTRIAVPLAALAFFVLSSILRLFTYGFHSGIVILELLAILAITPCGDGFSLDRWIAARRGSLPPSRHPGTYGWAELTCLAAIASCYVCAGASKLRAGRDWFRPESFEYKLLTDSLQPIYLDMPWKLSLWLHHAHAPAALYTFLAVAGVAVETTYGAILFSRRLRAPVALAAAGLHLGILFLQNILFLDLLLIQLVLVDRAPRGSAGITAAEATPERPTAHWRLPAAGVAALVATCGLIWMLRVECFPLTSWAMYSDVNRSPLRYVKMIAVLEDGSEIRLPPSEYALAAFPNSASTLKKAFVPS